MKLRAAAGLAAGIMLAATASLAQAAERIRFAVTDLAGLEQLQREFGEFSGVLRQATGLEVDFFPVTSRTAAVEAMNAKRIDFVLTGPAEYVVFRKRGNAAPVVGFSRPDYFSNIVVLAGSPYQLPADLKGRKVAFGDVGSTSTHLGPIQTLADQGLVPGRDYQPMHVNRNVAMEALIRGDIAAVGMNFTHLKRAEASYPGTAFRVIARGRDLPADVLLAGAHVPESTVATVRKAFTTHGDALLKAMMVGEDNQKFKGGRFLPTIADAEYNYVRSMYATIGFPEYADFVGQ
ncbi:PhnD/SsuA/transferrin family substrate-binding protein [Arenibaculum pallidiluteum]|uniref:PhnD/SsuA/transferrin family substrate-binding protein n=1 Tax=Arenibaculum pallidiluteum TaxID=2812559 RepID=UPI001A95CE98|nr:PhnD/SsuA/transferrin family substrate-binding protein [Arenibaculum pallidiluteum]